VEKYCVNTETNENHYHEVHKMSCDHLPNPEHQKDLGYATLVLMHSVKHTAITNL